MIRTVLGRFALAATFVAGILLALAVAGELATGPGPGPRGGPGASRGAAS
jgi:hypothetical protein